ncbi:MULTISPECIES: aromatic acid exporter family protein [unclassified Streptomyces]|uniref:aromatic acid exporter family protein n=1 Tax=Streptomycetaceae TaxID=2062 RepID=UPI002E780DFF|nr:MULTISPECIES: aromatic acid exporter family protein [unclassified Streptomyces]MED7953793.1 aromatic acid exporter family protein [Streptomyces sp. BE303]MEE1825015.1 aromatic acid exporter family protein [Streptomyces sp. BE20]
MSLLPDSVAAAVRRGTREPFVVQTVRATVAATLSYVVATWLSSEPAPLTAPLTALLVVQVTVYSTLTTSIRRVNSVVVGVLIAIGFSSVVGLSWWSLGLVILASLVVGRFVRVDEFVQEVAISAMLILGVTKLASQAWDRVLETLIGAVVGLLFNLLFAPPVWVDTAGESIEDLARRARQLLLDLAEQLDRPTPVAHAAERLHEARRLDQAIADVDAALRQAEDSLRLNPRISEGLLSRLVLRTGLDTLEICVVVIRVLARSLTDLAKRRPPGEPLVAPDVAVALEELLAHIGGALVSFAVLVTTQVSRNAEEAEQRLTAELTAAWASRENVARLLLDRVREHPEAWQLHGALLAEVDRILDELDLEHRSRRLMEELDRASVANRERFSRLAWLRRLVRGERLRSGRLRRKRS